MGWLNGRLVDMVVLAPILWRAVAGYREGLVGVLYGLIGRLLGLFVGWRWAPTLLAWAPVARLVAPWQLWLAHEALSLDVVHTAAASLATAAWLLRLAALAALFLVAQAALRWMIGTFASTVNRVPFVGGINRFTGAAAAAASAALVVALVLVLAADAGVSWHVPQVLAAERSSGAARTLVPVGRSLLGWLMRGVPGTSRLLAKLPGFGPGV